MDTSAFSWTREPKDYVIGSDRIEITTAPHTDLWQRTYYHFRNDNAPVLQMETAERYFSFVVKTDFSGSHHRFDQCGIVMYLDSENWLKGSIEYENDEFQHLGSVVTNNGYSQVHVVPVQPSRGRLLHRMFAGRRQLLADAYLPYGQGRRHHPVRHLRLFAGGFLLHRGVHGHADDGMSVAGARRAAARRRVIPGP